MHAMALKSRSNCTLGERHVMRAETRRLHAPTLSLVLRAWNVRDTERHKIHVRQQSFGAGSTPRETIPLTHSAYVPFGGAVRMHISAKSTRASERAFTEISEKIAFISFSCECSCFMEEIAFRADCADRNVKIDSELRSSRVGRQQPAN